MQCWLFDSVYELTQEEEPNDRKIGKLCDYSARNPLRIPKVWNILTKSRSFLVIHIVTCDLYFD
jgi:hypothetical protein